MWPSRWPDLTRTGQSAGRRGRYLGDRRGGRAAIQELVTWVETNSGWLVSGQLANGQVSSMNSGQTRKDLTVLPRTEPVHQVSDSQQTAGGERAPAIRDDHERIGGRGIGPPCWQREQHPVLVTQVNPVLTPVLAAGDELELAAIQRVERMRHPHP